MIRDHVVGLGSGDQARVRPRPRLYLALLALGALLVLAPLAAVGGYEITYQDRVYAGVSLAGQDLGGMQADGVRTVVNALAVPGGALTLRAEGGQRTWTYTRHDLGTA